MPYVKKAVFVLFCAALFATLQVPAMAATPICTTPTAIFYYMVGGVVAQPLAAGAPAQVLLSWPNDIGAENSFDVANPASTACGGNSAAVRTESGDIYLLAVGKAPVKVPTTPLAGSTLTPSGVASMAVSADGTLFMSELIRPEQSAIFSFDSSKGLAISRYVLGARPAGLLNVNGVVYAIVGQGGILAFESTGPTPVGTSKNSQ